MKIWYGILILFCMTLTLSILSFSCGDDDDNDDSGDDSKNDGSDDDSVVAG